MIALGSRQAICDGGDGGGVGLCRIVIVVDVDNGRLWMRWIVFYLGKVNGVFKFSFSHFIYCSRESGMSLRSRAGDGTVFASRKEFTPVREVLV